MTKTTVGMVAIILILAVIAGEYMQPVSLIASFIPQQPPPSTEFPKATITNKTETLDVYLDLQFQTIEGMDMNDRVWLAATNTSAASASELIVVSIPIKVSTITRPYFFEEVRYYTINNYRIYVAYTIFNKQFVKELVIPGGGYEVNTYHCLRSCDAPFNAFDHPENYALAYPFTIIVPIHAKPTILESMANNDVFDAWHTKTYGFSLKENRTALAVDAGTSFLITSNQPLTVMLFHKSDYARFLQNHEAKPLEYWRDTKIDVNSRIYGIECDYQHYWTCDTSPYIKLDPGTYTLVLENDGPIKTPVNAQIRVWQMVWWWT